MADHPVPDDSSHYEISLTAGQAFIAFVLLLCSLGAAFAFGILVGRGQLDERLVVRRDPTIITEGESPDPGRIVDLGAREPAPPVALPRDFTRPAIGIEELAPTPSPGSEFVPQPAPSSPPAEPRNSTPAESATPPPAVGGAVIAQVLSSTEQRAAENLAAKLIDSGFENAYVERVDSGGAMIHRVRVRFSSEEEARAAVSRLKSISGTDPWITRP
jgi:cell division septation protein DedD